MAQFLHTLWQIYTNQTSPLTTKKEQQKEQQQLTSAVRQAPRARQTVLHCRTILDPCPYHARNGPHCGYHYRCCWSAGTAGAACCASDCSSYKVYRVYVVYRVNDITRSTKCVTNVIPLVELIARIYHALHRTSNSNTMQMGSKYRI